MIPSFHGNTALLKGRSKRIKRAALRIVGLVGALLLISLPLASGAAAREDGLVTIAFTTDIHSHMDTFTADMDGVDQKAGGIARIKTILDGIRQDNKNVLVVDGGDFSMGTLYQTLFTKQAVELEMLTSLGYDAVTLGNHEFDCRAEGLAEGLQIAAQEQTRPALVLCNVDRTADNDYTKALSPAFAAYGVADYVMLEKGGVRIAVTGVFGKDSIVCSPTCELKFLDPIESVKKTVEKIKATEDADMIVCLSHSGIDPVKPDNCEDALLAKAVPALDVIVSGHTHLETKTPITYGHTHIVSAGCYGKYVGNLSLCARSDGRWDIERYALIPVTDAVAEDPAILNQLDAYAGMIDEGYLSAYVWHMHDVIACSDVAFEPSILLEDGPHVEYRLGNLMADALREKADSDVAIVPAGLVRDTLYDGSITVSEVFDSFSLGIGPDGTPGYPLVVVYLTGKDLRTLAEVDASVGELMNTAKLYTSGFGFAFNPNRLFLNRVTDTFLLDGETPLPIDENKLYSAAVDLYSCQMLSSVKAQSLGLLSMVPKDADGKPLTDFESCILTENGKEVKAWAAIAEYLEGFEKNADGVAAVPQAYAKTQGRKRVEDDKSLSAILSAPNHVAIMLGCAVLIMLVVVAAVIVLLKRRRRRKNRHAA